MPYSGYQEWRDPTPIDWSTTQGYNLGVPQSSSAYSEMFRQWQDRNIADPYNRVNYLNEQNNPLVSNIVQYLQDKGSWLDFRGNPVSWGTSSDKNALVWGELSRRFDMERTARDKNNVARSRMSPQEIAQRKAWDVEETKRRLAARKTQSDTDRQQMQAAEAQRIAEANRRAGFEKYVRDPNNPHGGWRDTTVAPQPYGQMGAQPGMPPMPPQQANPGGHWEAYAGGEKWRPDRPTPPMPPQFQPQEVGGMEQMVPKMPPRPRPEPMVPRSPMPQVKPLQGPMPPMRMPIQKPVQQIAQQPMPQRYQGSAY